MAKVYEKTCIWCGKPFQTQWKSVVCCSVSCGASYGRNKHVDQEFDWQKENDRKYTCRYNPEGCACSDRNCTECGHNPAVAKARLTKIRARMLEGGGQYGTAEPTEA